MNDASLPDTPTRESALAAAAAILSRRVRDARDDDLIAVAIASRVRLDDVGRALEAALRDAPTAPSRLHLFAADLCLDTGGACSAGLAQLGAKLGLPPRNIHFPVAGGDVLLAARAYAAEVAAFFGLAPGAAPRFDAVCLAPADLDIARGTDLAERLAVGSYDTGTGRCSVWLTWESLTTSPAIISIGSGCDSRATNGLSPTRRARIHQLHWVAERADACLPKRETPR